MNMPWLSKTNVCRPQKKDNGHSKPNRIKIPRIYSSISKQLDPIKETISHSYPNQKSTKSTNQNPKRKSRHSMIMLPATRRKSNKVSGLSRKKCRHQSPIALKKSKGFLIC